MSQWTTLDLLTTIKSRAMIPDASSGSLGPATLINFATEELLITLVPMIIGVRERYYETFSDTTLTSTLTSIPIPSRAIGGAVSSVQYVNGTYIRQLLPIDPSTVVTTVRGTPTNYYFENNSIVPYPLPQSTTGTIRMRYFQRPNRLEQTTNCAQITTFDATTVTCAAVPSTWSSSSVVDFIPKTQAQATPYAVDKAVTNVASNVLTFAAVPSATAIGDWVALSEYTPIPEIPFEFQAVLAQATACKALEAIKDRPGLEDATKALMIYQKAAVAMMTPRDQNGPKKVVSDWRRF